MSRRITARAIIVREGRLLMFERWRRDIWGRELHYYSIPGGGIEKNETPEEAVIRELKEEMSIDVRPLRLLAVQRGKQRTHHYFLCEIVSGEPRFNPMSEEALFRNPAHNRYAVAWIKVSGAAVTVRHDEYRQILEALPKLLADSSVGTVDIAHPSE